MWKNKLDKALAKCGGRFKRERYGLGLCWIMRNSAEWLDDEEYLTLYDKLLDKFNELLSHMVGKGWNIDLKSLAVVIPEEQLEEIAKELMGE